MRRRNNKFLRFIYFLLPVLVLLILIISFFAFKKLVSPYDLKLKNGKRLSVVAAQIKEDLFKKYDITQVNFNTQDGIRLSGYFVKRKWASGNLILAHGYQSCKEMVSSIIDLFPNYNILMFDFRGHGKSEGRFRTLGCLEYKDIFAAVDFLNDTSASRGFFSRNLPVFILGISMGGAVAIEALKRRPDLCNALVIDSAYANLTDVISRSFKAKSGLPSIPFAYVVKKMVNFAADCDIDGVNVIEGINNIKQPILFIHACKDKIVDIKDSIDMYSCANEKSKILITPVCEHGYICSTFSDLYSKKINKFLKKSVA
ncbi:lysophospholipase [Candidatus Dependentiae bacterium]|nr:lysophospholipase [Candidatus Dependentiae bacterium]MBU4387737.1 lysophospholipase [Candidatus Dependentiae bacterium]MCG2756329.1 lysophospholipase [Candidatus Dependentiae bacterium]